MAQNTSSFTEVVGNVKKMVRVQVSACFTEVSELRWAGVCMEFDSEFLVFV